MGIKKNTIFNLFGSFLPIFVSIATIPLYIKVIGEERYGVLAIAWLFLGYFTIFDFGLGRAISHRMAELKNCKNKESGDALYTALVLNILLGIIGGLIMITASSLFFSKAFKFNINIANEMRGAIYWLSLAVPIATVSGVLNGALQGREKFFETNVISVAGSIMFQVVPLFVAHNISNSLNYILPAVIFSRVVVTAVLFFRCKLHFLHGAVFEFKKSEMDKLLSFGGWIAVSSLISPLMVVLDRFIIGAMLGAKAVSYYTVPFQLAERSGALTGAINSALYPRLVIGGGDEVAVLVNKSYKIILYLMTGIMSIGLLVIKPFMSWWISVDFAIESYVVAKILIVGFWINGLATVPYIYLQAKGRPGLVAKAHMFELVPYLGILYMLSSKFGLVGAAAAFLIRVAVDFLILTHMAREVNSFKIKTIPFLIFIVFNFYISEAFIGKL